MPYYETIDELAEWIANIAGVYGCGPEDDNHPNDCKCRICFVGDISARMREAVENENMIKREMERKIRGV